LKATEKRTVENRRLFRSRKLSAQVVRRNLQLQKLGNLILDQRKQRRNDKRNGLVVGFGDDGG
jgi:hypothetical protein